MPRPLATTAAAALTSTALLVVAVGQGWLGPDVGRGAQFCEAPHPGWVRQPANTLSNAGFVVAGLLVAARARRLPPDGVMSTTVATWFACVVVLLGPASAAMHATQSELGGHLDMLSMYLVAGFAAAWAGCAGPDAGPRPSPRRTSPACWRACWRGCGPTRCRWCTTPATWPSACCCSRRSCSRRASGGAVGRRSRSATEWWP